MSINALVNFKPNEKIKSSEVNDNFQYIMNDSSKKIAQLDAYLKSNIEELKNYVQISMPIGTYIVLHNDKEGFLWCNGASLLIEDYEELYSEIGITYGQEDAYHFNLPDLRNVVIEGYGDESELLYSIQEGRIPNITGFLNPTPLSVNATSTGIIEIVKSGSTWNPAGSATNQRWGSMKIDASLGSDVYSDEAERVTVDRIKLKYYIRAY